MTAVLVDSNVLLDIATEDPAWGGWSAAALERTADQAVLVINALVYAEVSVGFAAIEELEAALPRDLYRREDLPYEAAFLAGKVFLRYRQGGGAKRSPLPDFYIGETIDPLALVEDLRAASEGRRAEEQLGFFAPYSELSFDEKEGLKGQVQTIYVDPPYGIKRGVGPLGATSAIGRVSVTAGGLTAAIVQSYCVG